MFKPLIRGWTLLMRELVEVLRQPFLAAALVLGPFLILFVFAIGHLSQQPPLTAILVVPPAVNLPHDLASWHQQFGGTVNVVSLANNEAQARGPLDNRQVDLVLVIPANAFTTINHGQQATIRVIQNQINPVDQAYVDYVAYVLSAELNKRVITEAARKVQADVRQSGQPLAQLHQNLSALPVTGSGPVAQTLSDVSQLDVLRRHLESLSPQLVAAPFRSQVENTAPIRPSFIDFYSPGVLALLLQHIAITFTALSLVRDRQLGMIELYKVAPTSTFGVLFGKYASYALLTLVVGTALTFLMTRAFGVPILGSQLLFGATLALLVFASLGVGLTISLISASSENAVQLTMLVLLASVFFSGFVFPLSAFQTPATQLSLALPVTHAIIALQDLMLRGQLTSMRPLAVLGGMGILFMLINARLLSRELRRS